VVGPLPPGLLAIPALAVAAGVDLYLTLFLLSAAPLLGLWPTLPGALADLSSPGVLAVTGVCYLAELVAERRFTSSILWNALHAVIRPVSGGLLAFLLLDGQAPALLAGGTVVAALLAFAAHAVATGGHLLLRLERSDRLRPVFPSLLEDTAVLAVVVLTLDRPAWGAVATAGLLAIGLPLAGSWIRAFVFSVRLFLGAIRTVLARDGWLRPGSFPPWLVGALERLGVGHTLAEGGELYGGLRAAPGAGLRLPGRPRLVTGWLVVHGERPVFVHGQGPDAHVDLDRLAPRWAADQGFLRVVELAPPPPTDDAAGAESSGPAAGEPPSPLLLLPRDGPSLRNLRTELGLPGEDDAASTAGEAGDRRARHGGGTPGRAGG
jgi:hypothetical protein